MPTVTLNQDIWYMIFEHAAEDRSEPWLPHPLCSIILVCKAWKVLATPLLYRHTVFIQPDSFDAFRWHLVESEDRGYQPGAWVASLVLNEDYYESESQREARLAVFPYLRNLRSFTSDQTRIFHRDLGMLAVTCWRTLRNLDIILGNSHAKAFKAIKLLTSLCRLRIDFEGNDEGDDESDVESDDEGDDDEGDDESNNEGDDEGNDEGNEDHEATCTLRLPQLKALELCFSFTREYSRVLPYFKQCWFPKLRQFGLQDLPSQKIHQLEPFLSQHGHQLEWINFGQSWPASFPNSLIPNAHHICLVDTARGSTAFSYLQYLPSTARHLHVKFVDPSNFSHFEPLFQCIISRQCGALLESIHLIGPNFTWKALYLNSPDSTGNWVRIAIRLQEQGIWLTDANGLAWNLSPVIRTLEWAS